MQFEVPQFIEIEDKIIGPLTWKQFIYVGGGVGVIVMLFLSSLPRSLVFLIGIPVGALAASLAFHRVNNRPFSFFLEAMMSYMTHTKLYLWRRETMQEIIEKETDAVETFEIPASPASAAALSVAGKRTLRSLSRALDTHAPEQPNT